MSINRAILIGRLTRTPELRITPNNISVTTVTIAVDRHGGKNETDFIDVVMFGKLAENVCKYQDKGNLIAVDGHIQTRSFETKEGWKRKVVEVVAESVQFLRQKKQNEYEDVFEE